MCLIMRVNNDRTQGIYLREEMGFIPNVKEIKEDGKKKKKNDKNKVNGKNKTQKNNGR